MSVVCLLGPQRLVPTLAPAMAAAGVEGAVAAVTAGWQEREEEVDELAEHLGRRVVNLRLYARAEEVFRSDRELHRAWRERQERLRNLQQIYRIRLAHALDAARELMRRRGDETLLAPEREAAIGTVRRLDEHHRRRVHEIHADFEERWRPARRRAVAAQRGEIAALVEGCEAVAVAGGHVAILLNRLRLFGIRELVGTRPLFAWSAGAMATGELVVLFHDDPPQGRGNAEVLEEGLGLHRGVLPLPHARRRLALDEPPRVELFARRFLDHRCLALDDGQRVTWGGERWEAGSGVRELRRNGSVREVAPA